RHLRRSGGLAVLENDLQTSRRVHAAAGATGRAARAVGQALSGPGGCRSRCKRGRTRDQQPQHAKREAGQEQHHEQHPACDGYLGSDDGRVVAATERAAEAAPLPAPGFVVVLVLVAPAPPSWRFLLVALVVLVARGWTALGRRLYFRQGF